MNDDLIFMEDEDSEANKAEFDAAVAAYKVRDVETDGQDDDESDDESVDEFESPAQAAERARRKAIRDAAYKAHALKKRWAHLQAVLDEQERLDPTVVKDFSSKPRPPIIDSTGEEIEGVDPSDYSELLRYGATKVKQDAQGKNTNNNNNTPHESKAYFRRCVHDPNYLSVC
jgi:hypothetical protein